MQSVILICLGLLASIEANVPFHRVEMIGSLPKDYVFDPVWSESCKRRGETLEYDLDQDGFGDSIFIRSVPSKKGKIKSWKNLDWIQPAIKMSKTSKYVLLPIMIDDEHSAWIRTGCADDFRLNLTADSCTKKGRYNITHGVPTGYDEKISYPLSDKFEYYFPDLSWMKNASNMPDVISECVKSLNVKVCDQGDIMIYLRSRRSYYFEIDSDTLKIYSASQHFEACNNALREK